MLETLLAFGLIAGLVGIAALLSNVDWYYVFGTGLTVLGGGLVLSITAGLSYHLRLRRVLLKTGPMPKLWWLFPTKLHDRLGDDKPWVMRPFFWGATGMVVAITGCLLVAYGAWRSQ